MTGDGLPRAEHLNLQYRQRLPNIIVQFSCNSGAVRLLCIHHFAAQLIARHFVPSHIRGRLPLPLSQVTVSKKSATDLTGIECVIPLIGSSREGRDLMPPRVVVMVAAWLEIVVGVLFITALDTMCRLLFAAGPEGAAMPLGRLVGVALFSLGVASLPSSSSELSRSVVMGLFAYNLGAATLFAWTAVATTLRGLMLWPGVLLHLIVAGALLPQLLARRPVRKPQIEPTHQL